MSSILFETYDHFYLIGENIFRLEKCLKIKSNTAPLAPEEYIDMMEFNMVK